MSEYENLTLEELTALEAETVKNISKYHNMQINRKVQLNSAFGFLGNEFSRFYDTRLAEAITLSGQLSIRWIQRKLNEHLNDLLESENQDYVIASDTDSVYLNMAVFVNKVLSASKEEKSKQQIVNIVDKFCEKNIVPFINKCYEELAEQQNAFEQKMNMSREAIADCGIWTAKKRYALNVWNNEGVAYTEPKMKIMGMEVVRSSTPNVCRAGLKDCIKIMLTGENDELIAYIEDFREKWNVLPMQDIGRPTGLNGLDKYGDDKTVYGHKTPIHVRGALMFNHKLKEKKLDKKYSSLKEGDKVKFIYLKEPNPIQEDVISMDVVMPKEFDLEKYVDYDRQFEKAFLDPIKNVATCIGWNVEQVSTLDAFFG